MTQPINYHLGNVYGPFVCLFAKRFHRALADVGRRFQMVTAVLTVRAQVTAPTSDTFR